MNIDPVASAAVAATVGSLQRPVASGPGEGASAAPPLKSPDSTPVQQAPQQQQQDVEGAVRSIDQAINPFGLAMQFSRDDETGSIVLKMINQSTGEIMRQIPNEVSVKLAATLSKLQGQIIDRHF